MLSRITSLTQSGLKDWFLQRVSAVILASYFIFLTGFIIGHHPLEFRAWFALFHHISMKIFTILALLSLFAHSWIGMWTIYTDYVKITALRLVLHILTVIALLACFIVMIQILWS